MSHDWPWTAILAAVLPPALGHLYLFIVAINLVSALGYCETVLDRARSVLFLSLYASSSLLLWRHLHDPWWTWSWPGWCYAASCAVLGTVIWPANSLYLALRRRPEGVAGRASMRDLAESHGRDALIGDGNHAWLLRLPGNESFRLWLREWDVAFSGLPEPMGGLRILHLTDLHFARCFERRFFETVIEACGVWDADLIVLTGDVVDEDDVIEWIEPVLGRLEARLGKFAILGNHDESHRPREVVRELGRAGFETLEGRWTTIDVDGTTLALGGTSAPWGPAPNPDDIPPADFRLLLSHSPDLFYRARRWGVDLMLSGHNHGGQIRLPLVGSVFVPSLYSRRFDRGFFRKGSTLLYVSEGVAGMHPVRYGCPPEVTRLTLRAAVTPTGLSGLERRTAHGRKHAAIERDSVQG